MLKSALIGLDLQIQSSAKLTKAPTMNLVKLIEIYDAVDEFFTKFMPFLKSMALVSFLSFLCEIGKHFFCYIKNFF